MTRNFSICCIVLALILTACSPSQKPAGGLPRVLAAESFLADIAQNIAGDRLKVNVLISLGVDPHNYQLTPRDTAKLAESNILIVNGIDYEWWLQKTLDNIGGQRLLIVASNGLTPITDSSSGQPAGDPHMWLDPLKVIHYVENIRDDLIQSDPAGRDIYTHNATAYISQLNDLDHWIRNKIAQVPIEKRLLVTNHESLGYFAKEYGFHIVGAITPSLTTDASPSAQQMAGLIQTIHSSGAKAIFLEMGSNPNLAQQVAAETGVKVVSGLYLESLSSPAGPAPTYLQLMKYDVTQIVEALK